MTMRTVAVWMLLAGSSFGAWTERYVSPTGAGTHSGDSEANAFDLAEAIADSATAADGTRYNIIAGTYANTTTSRTFNGAGSTAGVLWWRGYNTTIGDIDANNALAKPAITFTTGEFIVSGAFQHFDNLDISGAGVTTGGQLAVSANDCQFHRLRVENTAANANGRAINISAGARCSFTACWAQATSSANCVSSVVAATFDGCVIRGGLLGVFVSQSCTFTDCIILDASSHGLQSQSTVQINILNPTIYNCGGSGIFINSTAQMCYIRNPIIVDCGAYGVAASGATSNVKIVSPSYYSNTSGETSNIVEIKQYDAVTESAIPFTDAASEDFTLKATALAKGTGFPGEFENETFSGFIDRGAVQREESASSSVALPPIKLPQQ